jgi:type II restriction/modification system DNA methylase subunit YeeA
MNTNNIKKYAPQARREFIEAIGKRLNQFGIYADGKTLRISDQSFSGSVMQIDGNSFDAGLDKARKRLVIRAEKLGFAPLVEHVAYTWFNRLCAIRFMELKTDYLEHGLRVLSHPEKANSFEILDHAQDAAEALGLDRNHIVELKLAGNKDEELYRYLLLGQCHQLHKAMPFLFEALDDETELLLPDNLIRTDSILRGLVDSILEEDWEQVEIIGWLYQFYISEKKDQVIGSVVKSEDIPAATQLFTPNWIVKYLVQNSVGRQWLMTYPDSSLKGQMEYYIEPAEQEASVKTALAEITPTSIEPESIKVIDPACGSGHILVEAYDVLKAIYEERGYRSRDIPKYILENNIFGLDIDDRAAQLAGFALMMKARADDKRIFTRDIKLNVLALQSTQDLNLPELWRKLDLNNVLQIGTTESIFDDAQSNLIDAVDDVDFYALESVLVLFEQAKTFGSLIQVPHDKAEYLQDLKNQLEPLIEQGDNYKKMAATVLLPFVKQAWLLAQQYDAVIANPPYMGSKYQTPVVKKYLKDNFNGYEKDLFSAFIVRNLQLAKEQGQLGFMTPFVWMFISSYEELRKKLIEETIISTLIQLEYSGFDGATVPICTFTLSANHIKDYVGNYIKLSDFKGHQNQAPKTLEAIQNKSCGWFYQAKPDEFNNIPGSPIAYWVGDRTWAAFKNGEPLIKCSKIREGINTGDNERFLRLWHEVDFSNIQFTSSNDTKLEATWVPHNKGGRFRKWYGNTDYVLKWKNHGEEIHAFHRLPMNFNGAPMRGKNFFFKKSISWSRVSSGDFASRFYDYGYSYDSTAPSLFAINDLDFFCLGFLNSNVVNYFLAGLSPTLDYRITNVSKLPVFLNDNAIVSKIKGSSKKCVELSRNDWNSFETSFNFLKLDWLAYENNSSVSVNWGLSVEAKVRNIKLMKQLEEENNYLFIEAYGLQGELFPEIPENKITLASADREKDCQQLMSYTIGCMMGRYRLDKPGLIYAHSGNNDFDKIYNNDNANPFTPDDGIIPLTDQEWFKDDATNRFRDFVRTVWGEENLQENLDFVAESLCLNSLKPKKSESNLETVRRYLSTQFYKDHLKTYKKRPIYWLFSSGKQKGFECLVYLHRYNESTLSRMRTEYVTPLLGKYDSFALQLNKQMEDASTTEATRLKKDLIALEKKQTELRAFDDKLKHYADMRIKIDLDDGVKVNYGKFGDLLSDVKAVTGEK